MGIGMGMGTEPRIALGTPPPAPARSVRGLLLPALLAACAGPRAVPGEAVSPRLHHRLDLEDARAPLRELLPFLRDADPEVRARAALAAARTADPLSADLLRAAAADPDRGVRVAAALGMGLTDAPGLAADALDLARRDGSAEAAAAAVRLAGPEGIDGEGIRALAAAPGTAARQAGFRALPGALRGWKTKPAAPAWVVGGLEDPDPEVRQAAALTLRSLPHPAPADDLLLALAGSDPQPDVRAAAAIAAAGDSPGHDGALAAALEREPVARVRAALVRGLGGGKGEESRAAIRGALGDPDFAVRAAAADFLSQRAAAEDAPPAGTAGALAAVAARDAAVLPRVAAVEGLQRLGGDEAAAAVLRAAGDPDPFVRAAAAGPRLPAAELARLARDPDVRVREAAATEAGTRGRAALDLLLEALEDPDPVVAAGAAGGLGEIGATEAAERLRTALARAAAPDRAPDDAADLRAAALEALGKLHDPGVPDLALALLQDPDPSVRRVAGTLWSDARGNPLRGPIPRRLLPFPPRDELRTRPAAAPRVRFETGRGTLVVALDPAAAPVHVARLLERVRAGGYDGTVFHRIVPNFVVQGGDPRGDGSGSGGATTRQEFSSREYLRGTLGVPRNEPPDSGGCQLFFCHGSTPHLDQRYTVMGQVVEGLEVLDRIDLGDRILRARAE